jgi:hypothetical protein
MHVLVVEDDNPGRPNSKPIVWEHDASVGGAYDLEACLRMGERMGRSYGRWVVCKVVPVASSGPEGWIEVDRSGEPVRQAEPSQDALYDLSCRIGLPLRIKPELLLKGR